MCVMVAGTGHDFINRHSCKDGLFIRTALFKDIEWDLKDQKGFGHADGNVKFGAGIVFAEAHKSAADNNRVLSSGWASTVGIIGWSIGGGMGPFSPSLGLGVDNILEVDIILANGTEVTANSKQNSDLYWAIRGGGGSSWGILTSITVKAYNIPAAGFTQINLEWKGNYCNDSFPLFLQLVDQFFAWSEKLDSKWGGTTSFTPEASNDPTRCGALWVVSMTYNFLGAPEDVEFKK